MASIGVFHSFISIRFNFAGLSINSSRIEFHSKVGEDKTRPVNILSSLLSPETVFHHKEDFTVWAMEPVPSLLQVTTWSAEVIFYLLLSQIIFENPQMLWNSNWQRMNLNHHQNVRYLDLSREGILNSTDAKLAQTVYKERRWHLKFTLQKLAPN